MWKDKMNRILVFSAFLLSVNLVMGAWWMGVVGGSLFLASSVVLVGRMEMLGERFWERLVFGSLGMFGLMTILLDGFYLLWGRFDPWMVFGSLWLLVAGLFLFGRGTGTRPEFEWGQPVLFSLISGLASLLLLGMLWVARTDIALVSPWNLFGPEPFILLLVAIVSAILASRERYDDLPLIVWMLVSFSALSVSAIVYAIGFGFDPFLHRAAEEALVQTGVVEPVRLLYSGQYVLVAAIHHLTAWPIKLIDIWLVPLVASVWLPMIATWGFECGWGLSRQQARMWWIGVLAIPFMLATFTVPFTVTYVLFLGVAVAYPVFLRVDARRFFMVLLALIASLFFHPLLTVPLLVFLAGAWISERMSGWQAYFIRFITTVAIGSSVPVMLGVYARGEAGSWAVERLLTELPRFFGLFTNPYWDPYPYIPWMIDALYEFRYWFPMGVFLAGVLLVIAGKQRLQRWSYLVFSLGMLFAILGASTLFALEGIIAHEQGEFAQRLLQALFVFSLPPLIAFFALRVRGPYVTAILLGVLVTVAWFFSYPQYNLKYPFFSPGVSADDVAAVHEIDQHSAGEPYLVLSHQLMSAAAIQELGFVHTYVYQGREVLWYAIPTGGPLYELYTSTIYEGPSRSRYAEAAAQTGVSSIYFALPSYWAWSAELITELEATSDQTLEVEGMTIYQFTSFD